LYIKNKAGLIFKYKTPSMAKVFSIEFTYKSVVYPAMVTVRSHAQDHSVFVQVFDKTLHDLLPDGELHFKLTNGVRKAIEPSAGSSRELVQEIRQAVTKQLNRPTLSHPY
jgi:hypothetical protein